MAACHDASFSGCDEMRSYFTSFGVTWQWLSDHGGGMSAADKDKRDKSHPSAIFRSQCIVVVPNTRFHMVVTGGKGSTESVAGCRASVNGNTSEKGFLGVAIHLVSDGKWVLSKRRSSSGTKPETLSFASDDLAPYVGQTVTVDVIDTCHGKWGWLYASSFLMQGTCPAVALGAEVQRAKDSLAAEKERAEGLAETARAEQNRSANLMAQLTKLSEGELSEGQKDAAQAIALQARVAELEALLAASELQAKKAQHAVEELEKHAEARNKELATATDPGPVELKDESQRIRELQAQLAQSERSCTSVKEAASRAADQLQEQALRMRELELRLGEGQGTIVQAVSSVAQNFSRLARCMKPRRGEAPEERDRLQGGVS